MEVRAGTGPCPGRGPVFGASIPRFCERLVVLREALALCLVNLAPRFVWSHRGIFGAPFRPFALAFGHRMRTRLATPLRGRCGHGSARSRGRHRPGVGSRDVFAFCAQKRARKAEKEHQKSPYVTIQNVVQDSPSTKRAPPSKRPSARKSAEPMPRIRGPCPGTDPSPPGPSARGRRGRDGRRRRDTATSLFRQPRRDWPSHASHPSTPLDPRAG